MTNKICEPALFELISAVAGERVYALKAPQHEASDTAPFVVFQRTESERWRSINGPSGIAQAFIQVDVYAVNYYTAKQLAADIEYALDGYRGIVYHGDNSPQDFVDIGGISLQNDSDILDETDDPVLYRAYASYLVTYTQ